jgi:methionyl-tRNA synthetase
MMSHSPFYITTAIDYVNGVPHLGHAYEKMATDAITRAYKAMGTATYFLTGTDEHGLKVEQNAAKHNQAPKAFVDELSQEFVKLWAHCDVAYDRFIRTTEEQHYALVAWMWQRMAEKGDIYKASYEGKYCTGCEAFLNERDMDDAGNCLVHQRPPEIVMEENYFFRLSHYKERLKQYFEENPEFVLPAFRKNEVLNMLEDLQDISVSRNKNSVSWGIPVPGDDSQVIYVWIDALSNYLTGLNFQSDEDALFHKFWQTPEGQPNAIHIIGKDILRFHAIYWPAMLMSVELPLPKTIFAHGFITMGEAKLSKSSGNVLSPKEITTEYNLPNADAVRYYLLTCTPFGQDGNFTAEEFKLKVNADLANNLGNLLNRSLSMLKKYCNGVLPVTPVVGDDTLLNSMIETECLRADVEEAYRAFDFQKVAALLLERVDIGNRAINDLEPWTLFKEERYTELHALLAAILESLRIVALLFQPLLPNLSLDVLRQLGFTQAAPLPFEALNTLTFQANHTTEPTGPILPRLDSELVGSDKKR